MRRELVRVCAVRGHVVLPAGTRRVEFGAPPAYAQKQSSEAPPWRQEGWTPGQFLREHSSAAGDAAAAPASDFRSTAAASAACSTTKAASSDRVVAPSWGAAVRSDASSDGNSSARF